MIRKIAVVSDVSVGYGSPQILSIMHSLLEEFPEAEGLLIEPDQVIRPPIKRKHTRFRIFRVFTRCEMQTRQWRIEYPIKCGEVLQRFKPDIVIYTSIILCPIHDFLPSPKPLSVAYFLEMPEWYHFGQTCHFILSHLNRYCDLLLHPEINRMESCMYSFRDLHLPQYVVYNTSEFSCAEDILPLNQCNGRILYQGTIDRDLTFADYFISPEVQKYPIDLYGLIEGPNEAKNELTEKFAAMTKESRYLGYVKADVLAELRRWYAYGIISWNPVNENFRLAAPNKLFDYIGSGVVPIAAPHPQCKYLIKKYNCGILLSDWSFEAFLNGLRYAMLIYGTPAYEEMRQNCIRAACEELNWDTQMVPVMKKLRELAAQRDMCAG